MILKDVLWGATTIVLVVALAAFCGCGSGDDDGTERILDANGIPTAGGVSQDGTGNTQTTSIQDCSQSVTITGDGNTVNGPDCHDNSGDDRDNDKSSEETNEASSA